MSWLKRKRMRFLVDENLPKEVAEALESTGADVIYVAASALAGRSDEYLNALAIAEERILVTRDLDFPLRDEPPPTGLLLLRLPSSFGRREIGRFIEQYVAENDLTALAGHLTVIAPGREPRSKRITQSGLT